MFLPKSVYTTAIMSFLDRFFGPTYEKELKDIKPLVTEVNEKEEEIDDILDI